MIETKAGNDGSPQQGGIVCAGNWIVDIVHTIDQWPDKNDLSRISEATRGTGGGAANVFTNLSGLKPGLPLFPVGCVGEDEYAEFIVRHCEDLGASTAGLRRVAKLPTAHTHVMSVPGDSRTFFYAGGANDEFSDAYVAIDDLAKSGARVFYLGYIMLLPQLDRLRGDGSTAAADLLALARQAGMTTCVDLVSANHTDFPKIVAAAAPHIDYLVINETEAIRAVGRDVHAPESTSRDDLKSLTQDLAACLLTLGVHQAVIIHTPEFALWRSADGTVLFCEPSHVAAKDIISPVGAGDAFCTGILYGVHESFEPAECLKLAHQLAAINLGMPTANGGIPEIGSPQWCSRV